MQNTINFLSNYCCIFSLQFCKTLQDKVVVKEYHWVDITINWLTIVEKSGDARPKSRKRRKWRPFSYSESHKKVSRTTTHRGM